jgi:hypothetical protein
MKVLVIGGGPAGMMSAITSAKAKNEVILIEKNASLGKKLLITGKGRCNITSSLDMSDFMKNIPGNGKFLYSAFQNYTNEDIISMLKANGLEVKNERGNRIFPITDKAQDVLNCFERELKKNGVKVIYNSKVSKILVDKVENVDNININIAEKNNLLDTEEFSENNLKDKSIDSNTTSKSNNKNLKLIVKGVELENKTKIFADKIILSTGGKSYPATGSTGDGYKLAKQLGHTVTDVRASIVPLEAEKEKCQSLQGLSLKNVKIQIKDIEKNKKIYDDFGEMMFTHFGVSGPTILSSSAHLLRYKNVDELLKNRKIVLSVDLKPALTEEMLDARILRDFENEKNKAFKNSLDKLLPQKMIPYVIKETGIDENKKVNEITKQERRKLLQTIKNIEIVIEGFRPIEEAIVTAGGISVKEINPKTMESKIVSGLYFAGEVIDVDAYTGGFNLQIAYSTGFLAGSNLS